MLVIFLVYWRFRSIRRRHAKRKAALTFTVVNNVLLFLGLLLVLLGRSISSPLGLLFLPQAISMYSTGTIIAVGGISFAIWSRHVLSTNWSHDVAIIKDQQFIRSGPYTLVRHPIYIGILIALFGTTLVAATFGSLFGFIFALCSLWQKACKEEQFLMTEFGQVYTNYQHEVKFLIPFIY
jgi:protein-S-isoprenylcysteine O-methyltransferase Ste14